MIEQLLKWEIKIYKLDFIFDAESSEMLRDLWTLII